MSRFQHWAGEWLSVRLLGAASVLLVAVGIVPAGAVPILVPNGSFESPAVLFVSPEMEAWQKTSRPEWYVEDGGFLWTQLTGLFKNPLPGAADRIENCDGNQAVWVFAVPGVGLYQEGLPGNASGVPGPSSALARFQVGNSYRLVAGVIGGGGGMSNGVPLQLSLYYRDALSNRVTVASNLITHSQSVFPSTTRLVQFDVQTAAVSSTDPWAGQPIGIGIDSLVGFELQGGYWDVDAVQLNEVIPLSIASVELTTEGLRFDIHGEVGARISVLSSIDPTASLSQWTSVATLTNLTGKLSFTTARPETRHVFWRALELPSE